MQTKRVSFNGVRQRNTTQEFQILYRESCLQKGAWTLLKDRQLRSKKQSRRKSLIRPSCVSKLPCAVSFYGTATLKRKMATLLWDMKQLAKASSWFHIWANHVEHKTSFGFLGWKVLVKQNSLAFWSQAWNQWATKILWSQTKNLCGAVILWSKCFDDGATQFIMCYIHGNCKF